MNAQQKEILDMYQQLNEEQKTKIFTEEQRAIIDGMLFFNRLFQDVAFYNTVQNAVGEQIYEDLKSN